MPQERLSMHKIKTILRLASLGLSQRQIARSCQIGQATVSDYLRMAAQAGLQWPEIADWDEDRLRAALVPQRFPPRTGARPAIRITRRSGASYRPTNTSHCSYSGRNTATSSQTATATAATAACIATGSSGRTSCSGTSIEPARNCSSTMPATPSRFTTPPPGKSTMREVIERLSLGPEILAVTDVLVDGPYLQGRHTNNGFISSSNQRIHLLSPRYSPADFLAVPRAELISSRWFYHSRRRFSVAETSAAVIAAAFVAVNRL